MSNIFVGEYSTLREVLRQIFVYGCYNRTAGSSDLSISARKYDSEIKRLRCFWSDKTNRGANAKNYLNRFLFDGYKDEENYLWRSYCTKAFSPQLFNLNIFFLAILREEEFKSIYDIYGDMDDTCLFDTDIDLEYPILFDDESVSTLQSEPTKKFFAYKKVTYQMLRRCLDDMTTMGIVERRNSKDEEHIQYRLSKDILSELEAEELNRLYQLLELWRDISPLPSLGYNVQRLVAGEIESCRGDELPTKKFFKAEDIFLQTILNDEIFYQLTVAIENKQFVSIDFINESFKKVVPLKIISDYLYGRQYIFGVIKNGRPFIRRIDLIKNLSLLEEKFNLKDYEDCPKFLSKIWCASIPPSLQALTKSIEVKIDFRISKKSELHIFERLKAEKSFGSVKEISNRHVFFSIKVLDPYELIPWIRSFGKYAQVSPSNKHDLANKLQSNFNDIRTAYFDLKTWKNFLLPRLAPIHRQSALSKSNAPKIFCGYRNLLFHAVQEAYNLILIEGKIFSRDSLRKFLSSHVAFSGREINDLVKQITTDAKSIKNFCVFKEANGVMIPSIAELSQNEISADTDKIPFLLTIHERRWLLNLLLDDEIFCSLLGSKLRAKLLALLRDVKPFPWKEIIVERGFRDNLNVDLLRLKENLRIIFGAMQNHRLLEYKNRSASGKIYFGMCRPEKIIYSPYLRSFQLSAITLGKEVSLQRMNISNLSELRVVEDNFPLSTSVKQLLEKKRRPETLRLAIKSVVSFNDVERAFLLFSTHEKSGHYNEKENIYYLDVKFYSFQVNSLIRKILSLGRAAVVLEPDFIRESILRRI